MEHTLKLIETIYEERIISDYDKEKIETEFKNDGKSNRMMDTLKTKPEKRITIDGHILIDDKQIF